MGRTNGHGPVRRKKVERKEYPKVFIDADSDYASVKIAPGVEARSYEKDGFVFCEDELERAQEIQTHLGSVRRALRLRAYSGFTERESKDAAGPVVALPSLQISFHTDFHD